AAIAEHQIVLLLLGAERQLGYPHRLPGLLTTLARQVQSRKQRERHADHADQRDEERQAEDEQRTPRQRKAVAPRQQHPDANGQQQAAEPVRQRVEQRSLKNRQVAGRADPTAQLEEE